MTRPAFTHDGTGTAAEVWSADPRWADRPPLALDGVRRVVVVAAHPDDESLGAGGLLATAYERGLEIDLVLLTAGELSHPASPTHSPEQLAQRRLGEAKEALHAVAPGAAVTMLALGDGAVADSEADVAARLVDLIGDGGGDAGRSTLAARRSPRPRGRGTGGCHRRTSYGRDAGGVPRLVVALGNAGRRALGRTPDTGALGRGPVPQEPGDRRALLPDRRTLGRTRRRGAPPSGLPRPLPRLGGGATSSTTLATPHSTTCTAPSRTPGASTNGGTSGASAT